MILEKRKLWNERADRQAFYTMYLQDNSDEIEKNRKHPAIIVCGGGGYLGISDREKEPVALYFLNEGYQAFVLEYRTAKTGGSEYPQPVYDLAKMIVTVREHADQWNIDREKIAVIGFSAGAHLCACMATQWKETYLSEYMGIESEKMKPDAVILSYPLTDIELQNKWMKKNAVNNMEGFMEAANIAMLGKDYTDADVKLASPISHITEDIPPVFLWHTLSDEMVYVINSVDFAKKIIEAGGQCELHIFENGLHGMSLANEQSGGNPNMISEAVAVWKNLAVQFLKHHFN